MKSGLLERNPWCRLPREPPFILPEDEPVLAPHAEKAGLVVDLPPQPYLGDPRHARVLILGLNPGAAKADYEDCKVPGYLKEWKGSLTFETSSPFFIIEDRFAGTAGGAWWRKRFRDLAEEVGWETVARRALCVEYFPYKSRRFDSDKIPMLPSQHFGFEIVREFLGTGLPVIALRSVRRWNNAVPELADRCRLVANVQNPTLNRTQLPPELFDSVLKAMSE